MCLIHFHLENFCCLIDLTPLLRFNERRDISVSSLSNDELLVAYETSPQDDDTKFHAVIRHTTESNLFGLPLLLSFDRDVTCSELYNIVWKSIKPFVMLDRDEAGPSTSSFCDRVKSHMRIRVTDATWNTDRMLRTGFDTESTPILPVKSDEKVSNLMCLSEKEKVRLSFRVLLVMELSCKSSNPLFSPLVCVLLS